MTVERDKRLKPGQVDWNMVGDGHGGTRHADMDKVEVKDSPEKRLARYWQERAAKEEAARLEREASVPHEDAGLITIRDGDKVIHVSPAAVRSVAPVVGEPGQCQVELENGTTHIIAESVLDFSSKLVPPKKSTASGVERLTGHYRAKEQSSG